MYQLRIVASEPAQEVAAESPTSPMTNKSGTQVWIGADNSKVAVPTKVAVVLERVGRLLPEQERSQLGEHHGEHEGHVQRAQERARGEGHRPAWPRPWLAQWSYEIESLLGRCR